MLLVQGNTGMLQEAEQLELNNPFKTLVIHKTISGTKLCKSRK